jgi:outer membrane lipoprotein SlyB
VGGVLGHQIGGGTGKDIATIGGAVGGAYVGHQMEKKSKQRIQYQVVVEMDDGTSRTFKFSSQTSYKVGDSVKVKNGKLVRP